MTARWRPFREVTHVVTQESISEYAEVSGDYNPLHTDPEYAAASRFGSIVAHGPVGLQALFEATAVWLEAEALPAGVSIDCAYRAPVRPGDAVTARLDAMLEHAGTLVLSTTCANQRGETVIEALVSVPRHLAPRAEA